MDEAELLVVLRKREIEQRDRELFLRDWEASVLPVENQASGAEKGAVDYSLLGLKSAFILNGGALVALPAVTPFFGINAAANKNLLVWTAATFMVGILLSAAATALSYFVMCYQGSMHRWSREKNAQIVIGQYFGHIEDGGARDKKRDEAARKEADYAKTANTIRDIAIGCAFATIVAFLIGSGILLHVAWGAAGENNTPKTSAMSQQNGTSTVLLTPYGSPRSIFCPRNCALYGFDFLHK